MYRLRLLNKKREIFSSNLWRFYYFRSLVLLISKFYLVFQYCQHVFAFLNVRSDETRHFFPFRILQYAILYTIFVNTSFLQLSWMICRVVLCFGFMRGSSSNHWWLTKLPSVADVWNSFCFAWARWMQTPKWPKMDSDTCQIPCMIAINIVRNDKNLFKTFFVNI